MRGVFKIKPGDWWSEQLTRLVGVHQDLRGLGLEGFGTGTVAIDLIALLRNLTNADDRRAVIDRATELSGPDVVAACLCHRALATLDGAGQHPERLDDAAHQAEQLLALTP